MPQNLNLISTEAVAGEVLKPSSSFSTSSPSPPSDYSTPFYPIPFFMSLMALPPLMYIYSQGNAFAIRCTHVLHNVLSGLKTRFHGMGHTKREVFSEPSILVQSALSSTSFFQIGVEDEIEGRSGGIDRGEADR